jgi:RNA polymerase primary sigma factor
MTASIAPAEEALLGAAAEWGLLTASEEIGLAQTMEAGRRAGRRLKSGKSSDQRADSLALQAASEARDRFIFSNIRLVYKHAARFRGVEGIDLADLVQEGVIGLIHAVDRYDWKRGHKFSTYATWWVRVYISRAHAETSKTIRTPLPVHVNIDKALSAADRLRNIHRNEPSQEEIASESGLTVEQTAQAFRIPFAIPADTTTASGKVVSLLDRREAIGEGADPEAAAELAVLKFHLTTALRSLDEDQHTAIALRTGLVDGRQWSYAEIGRILDCSPYRARKLCDEALSRLRERPEVVRLVDHTQQS